MGFDDLASRMGKRHGVSPKLLADPAALTRRSERNHQLALLLGGISITVITVVLTIWLAETGWSWPSVSGMLILSGGLAAVSGAKGLLKLRRARS